MTSIYNEVHGILSLFLKIAQGTSVDPTKLAALQAAFDNEEPSSPGLVQAVAAITSSLTAFNNSARRRGEAIADAIDELEDDLKDGTNWVIEPSLAEGLLWIRALIRGEDGGNGLAGGGEVSNPSTCWPSCLTPGSSGSSRRGSSSRMGGGPPPTCGC